PFHLETILAGEKLDLSREEVTHPMLLLKGLESGVHFCLGQHGVADGNDAAIRIEFGFGYPGKPGTRVLDSFHPYRWALAKDRRTVPHVKKEHASRTQVARSSAEGLQDILIAGEIADDVEQRHNRIE